MVHAVEEITSYMDSIVSMVNHAIAADSSNKENAPLPRTKPHVCNKLHSEVEDFKIHLVLRVINYVVSVRASLQAAEVSIMKICKEDGTPMKSLYFYLQSYFLAVISPYNSPFVLMMVILIDPTLPG